MDASNNDTMMLTQEEINFLKETFYAQASEMTEQLTEEVLALESMGCPKESVRSIKRYFHTLKGDSSSIGLKEVSELIHSAEDLMGSVEDKTIDFDGAVSDILLKVIDEVSVAIKADKAGAAHKIPTELKRQILELLKKTRAEKRPAASEYEELVAANCIAEGKTFYSVRLTFADDCLMRSAGAMLVSRCLSEAAEVVKLQPSCEDPAIETASGFTCLLASTKNQAELERLCIVPGVTANAEFEELDPAAFLKADEKAAALESPAPREAEKGPAQIRVLSEKVDQMMDLVGELVMGRSMIEQLVKRFEAKYPKDELVTGFLKANSFISRSLSDLQRSVMSIRMMPIERVFKRFPRMVRDLCKGSGKEIDLVLKGEHTELDKALIDVIGEPLLHIIRNAADHGIERPADRIASGKRSAGVITVEACHDDNDMVIRIEDDGRGIDTAMLREAAVRKGLLGREEAERLSDEESMNLIFMPGFSTAETVSEISGRGIGMDIVKASVEGVRGSVTLSSVKGKGTVFTLKFPLTLSIIRAIIVRIDGQLYALPLGSIYEITRATANQLESVAGKEVLRSRDKVIPLVRMNRLMGGAKREAGERKKVFVLMLNHGEKRIGLAVDALVGEKELVVKAVDERWVHTAVVSGASILGDGTVIMILNIGELVSRALTRGTEARCQAAAN